MDCNWDQPGRNPYKGTVAEAVARYNLPPPVAQELIAKAAVTRPDTLLTITKDSATAATGESFELTQMHFGKKAKCDGDVKRSKWAANHVEHALVYCAQNVCIAVPIICRNVTLLRFVSPPRGMPRISDNDWMKDTPNDGPPWWFDKPTPVPEPGTLALVGAGLVAAAAARRK